jgi:hypothetical protein
MLFMLSFQAKKSVTNIWLIFIENNAFILREISEKVEGKIDDDYTIFCACSRAFSISTLIFIA